MKSLRIAQVAPLSESVPPRLYGGTERVVAYLTDELVAQGHDVTLFASGDSRTSAELIACSRAALRLAGASDEVAYHIAMLESVVGRAKEFDVIHFHTGYLHYPLTRRTPFNHVTTMHGRLDLPELVTVCRAFPEIPVVSISNAQRRPLPWLEWAATIYHGLPRDLLAYQPEPSDYVVFLGRISPEKRLDRAIEIAGRAGVRLVVAAKIDRVDKAYYEDTIRPLMAQPHVEYIGEVGEHEKSALLGNARALLFPIDWPEPFGLVMIEAMACGTPVIAFRNGSVDEVLADGETGFICESIDEAVAALGNLSQVSRAGCRATFERRFTSARMARDYVDLYRSQLDAGRHHPDRGQLLHPRHELADG
jgi:glycosyltransferase involved in cell wall biosynthesis